VTAPGWSGHGIRRGPKVERSCSLMLSLIPTPSRRPLVVLAIGAHCDDIEIGAGATLRQLAQARRKVTVHWAVLSGSAQRRPETTQAMKRLIPARARGELVFGDFKDGRFPSLYDEIKDFFESLRRRVSADIVFSHERDDLHQDHRIVGECTWGSFRDQVILEYEVPKWDGGLGQPNVYVPVSRQEADAKVAALMAAYGSQRSRDWFTRDTFMGLMRLRGVECRAPSGLAEAFHGRKLRVAVA
jgi:LmbE family N-acetylglucosaminyl deacetylase